MPLLSKYLRNGKWGELEMVAHEKLVRQRREPMERWNRYPRKTWRGGQSHADTHIPGWTERLRQRGSGEADGRAKKRGSGGERMGWGMKGIESGGRGERGKER